ncbi:MAG TPA: PilZ domain-containing protein [Candidatus Solibacter sp.]|nr:PilZ domain-containing protein [Candidatus Solibacter sp.]
MDPGTRFGIEQAREFVDARRHPRYKLQVNIRIYPRNAPVVYGETVDLSESGVSAMLRTEVPIGELVRLEFTLALGPVEVQALVRQRIAFRYGFQFVGTHAELELIAHTCRGLATEQMAREHHVEGSTD